MCTGDVLNQSPARAMATEWLTLRNAPAAQDKAAVQEWRMLRSLDIDGEQRLRSETARRELLDALTSLVERK